MVDKMDTVTTPKRSDTRRLSITDDDNNHSNSNGLLATPSPPSNRTHSRPPVSFLTTPVRTRLVHSHGEDDDDDDETEQHKNILSPYTKNSHNTSPQHKSRLLPPTTPKTRNTEMFLSPSPKLKSPGGGNSLITKDTKPIRDISNDLKTRLNYAFVKLQNGWVDKTLPELEQSLDNPYHSRSSSINSTVIVSPDKFKSHIRRTSTSSSSYVNKFANGNGDDMTPFAQLQRGTPRRTSITVTNTTDENENKDISMEDSTTSAHLAFLQALSSPKRDSNDNGSRNVSPLKWSNKTNNNLKLNTKKIKGEEEVVADEAVVETLMSLSSPQKSRPPTRIGDDDNDINVKGSQDDTDIETEIDTD
ncbi:hypothetical protein MOUN0_I01244 [Monosporozyma unispora]|nr:hypothetical protein C6P44_002144 [Kazachstania unispora]